MAITSLGLVQAVGAMFEGIKPPLSLLRRLGMTNFSDGAPPEGWTPPRPGTTMKVLVDSFNVAQEFNESTNNYLTGGATNSATLVAKHYLDGRDFKGTDIDNGSVPNVAYIEQKFSEVAGNAIGRAMIGATKTALDSVTQSTGVLLPGVADATLEDYRNLGNGCSWLTKEQAVLVCNPTEYSHIRTLLGATNFHGTQQEAGNEIDFADLIRWPGLTARAVIVPWGVMGFLARVPEIVADYKEFGIQTDPETRMSIGVVVANGQDVNKKVVNADLWWGTTIVSSPASAGTGGAIKVGTQPGH